MQRSFTAGLGRERIPATISLCLVALLAAFMGAANGGYFVGQWALAAFVLGGLTLLACAAGVVYGARHWASQVALSLFALYAVWTLLSLIWSSNKGDAWLGTGQTLLYLFAFWVSLALVALGASRRWALAASVIGPAAIAALTMIDLGSPGLPGFEDERLEGGMGYHNGLAAFLLVSFWVAVYLGGCRRLNPVLRGVVLACAALNANLAVLSQSRGAMVAMAISVPVFFLLSGRRLRGMLALLPLVVSLVICFPRLNGVYLAFVNGADPAGAVDLALPAIWAAAAGAGVYGLLWGVLDLYWSPPRWMFRATGAAVLAVCLTALVAGGVSFVDRFGEPAPLAQQKWEAFISNDISGQEQSRYLSASGTGRYKLWQVAWKDFNAHPLLGVGTQNYEASYYEFREQEGGSARQPHMLPLEVLGERGVVGGALFFGFLGVCAMSGMWQRFGKLGSEGRAQVGALLAAVCYWFVHSSAEWFWQLPAVTLPAILYLALLVSPWRETEPAILRWPGRAAGTVAAALALAVVAPLYAADHALERSRSASDNEQALELVERARHLNPLDHRLAVRRAELTIENGDWAAAKQAYTEAISLNPDHYASYMFLAELHERRAKYEEAASYYHEALERNPHSTELKKSLQSL